MAGSNNGQVFNLKTVCYSFPSRVNVSLSCNSIRVMLIVLGKMDHMVGLPTTNLRLFLQAVLAFRIVFFIEADTCIWPWSGCSEWQRAQRTSRLEFLLSVTTPFR